MKIYYLILIVALVITPAISAQNPVLDNYILQGIMANREELKHLEILEQEAGYNVRMYSADRFPSMFAISDYGFQGEEYHFTVKDDCYDVYFNIQRIKATEQINNFNNYLAP